MSQNEGGSATDSGMFRRPAPAQSVRRESHVKIVVLGAGVVGVTTAYRLAEDGHRVTVIERREGPALETSYANGGQLGACEVAPWAGPEVPGLVLRWLGRADAPFRLRPKLDPAQWRWLWQFLMRCRAAAQDEAAIDNLRLALWSRREFDRLHGKLVEGGGAPGFDMREGGILRLFREEASFDQAKPAIRSYAGEGLEQRELGAADCVDLEPALASAHQRGEIAGGIYSPHDRSGDAYLFTEALAARARDLGVVFRFGAGVAGFDTHGSEITAVRTDDGAEPADLVVVATGVESAALVHGLGLSLPVYPVKGYSVTVPARDPGAPRLSITDEDRKVVVSRLGDRLRAAGQAEVGGYDLTIEEARGRSVLRSLQDLFPSGADAAAPQYWCGLRPMTPDGRPVIGRAGRWANLILNTGHGTLGWTLAHASAAAVAALAAGSQPAVSLESFAPDRFSA